MLYFKIETLYVTLAALCVGTAGWFALSAAFGEIDTVKGINTILIGITIFAGDIYCRKQNPEPRGWGSIFDSEWCAPYGSLPGWIVGIVAVASGIALMIQAVN